MSSGSFLALRDTFPLGSGRAVFHPVIACLPDICSQFLTHSGKIGFQVDDIDGETANQIRNQTCQDLGYVLISNTSSAIDVQSVPISLEGTHLDPYFTQSFELNRQNFLNKTK